MVAHLATAGQRLPPWGDSVAELARIARAFPVVAVFVQRPRADTPADTDNFEGQFDELAGLRSSLMA